MTDNEFPYKEIVFGLMRVGYKEFDVIDFHLIDTLADYLIQIHVRNDKEFTELLGGGYYR